MAPSLHSSAIPVLPFSSSKIKRELQMLTSPLFHWPIPPSNVFSVNRTLSFWVRLIASHHSQLHIFFSGKIEKAKAPRLLINYLSTRRFLSGKIPSLPFLFSFAQHALDKKLEKSEKKQAKQSEFHESSKKNPILKQFFLSKGKWILKLYKNVSEIPTGHCPSLIFFKLEWF